jgi:hypothetical protein
MGLWASEAAACASAIAKRVLSQRTCDGQTGKVTGGAEQEPRSLAISSTQALQAS